MSSQIDVDDEVLDVLKQNAEPFTDTPNTVLRRLLKIDGTRSESSRTGAAPASSTVSKGKASKRAPRAAQVRPRAAAGTILPEERYELPLLAALVDCGGRAPYREVVEAVELRLKDELTPLDRDKLNSGGIRWQNRLQFVRLGLIKRGLLDPDTPRGVWGLTDKGRAAVEEGRTR